MHRHRTAGRIVLWICAVSDAVQPSTSDRVAWCRRFADVGRSANLRPEGARARRWVVERSHSWLNRNQRLLIRWERRADMYLAMLHFGGGLIVWYLALSGQAVNSLRDPGIRRCVERRMEEEQRTCRVEAIDHPGSLQAQALQDCPCSPGRQ